MDGDMFCRACGNPLSTRVVAYESDAENVCPYPAAPSAPSAPVAPPPQPAMPAAPRKPRRGWVTLALVAVLSVAIIVWQIGGAVISMLTTLDMDLCVTLTGALGAVTGVLILGGKNLFRFDGAAFALAWKKGWWVVAVSVLLMLWEITDTVVSGDPIAEDGWPLRFIAILLLCVGVGYYEESLFRGLVLGGLMDAFGGKKAGIVASVVLSSVVFGVMHIVGSELDPKEPLSLMQAFLKTLQTGTYGFFLAALVTKTGDLHGAIVLHALDDFFLMVPTSVLYSQPVETEYVTTGESALPTIMLYVVIILLYLPIVWQGVRLLGEVHAPNHGALHEGAEETTAS